MDYKDRLYDIMNTKIAELIDEVSDTQACGLCDEHFDARYYRMRVVELHGMLMVLSSECKTTKSMELFNQFDRLCWLVGWRDSSTVTNLMYGMEW